MEVKIAKSESEAQRLGRMIKYLRLLTGMNREDFANYLHIPLGTIRDWEQGRRKMPEYVYELIEYKVSNDICVSTDDTNTGRPERKTEDYSFEVL